ncbi:MAG: Ti-type conjugative transfer relaxase TraA [Hyphomicrobiaceae bacterium]
MSITHFRASIIQGTRGPVAAAAYRHRAEMYDMAAARTWDYSGAGDLAHAEIALPEGAPAWIAGPATTMSRASLSELLWNAAAAAEQRYDAQTAREITIALPSELSREQNIALMREFVAAELVSRGFAVDWVYHDKPGNPHVHLMHTLRPLEVTGFGRKTKVVLDDAGKPVRGADGRLVYTRFMGTPEDFKALRSSWGDYVNRHYALAGLSLRIDMRSYAARGIDMLPGRHLGPALSALKGRGYSAETLEAFARDAATRERMMRANPEIAVDLTAATNATFTRAELARTIHTFVSSPDAFQATLAAAEASPQLVPLTGHAEARTRFATQRQIAEETGIIASARVLWSRPHAAPSRGQIRRAVAATEAELGGAGAPARLSDQQRQALDALMQPNALTVVVGLAGTGKSTLLAAANRGWRSAGCTVHGAALAGIATRGLQSASGIPSRTVASWLAAWSAGKHPLSLRDVLVLDEAGMIGTSDMARIVAEVERAGAKLVVVGDPEQLQPIAAGAPFRAIADTVGHVTLSDIRRQADPAMRAATNAFARGDMAEGLKPYLAAGAVRTVETTDDAIGDMVEAYVAGMDRGGTQIALAYRNADVRRLNMNIRSLLRDTNWLGADALYRARDGELGFAAKDRVLFLETAKVGGVQVDNGAVGTVVTAERDALTVRMDSGVMLSITPETYAAVSHGYAATIHKSQGATVDTAHVLVTAAMDRHKAYVAFSRHRKSLAIYGPQDQLKGQEIATFLSQSDPHANAIATGAFRDRRGIEVPATERERAQTALATRRLLVSDAWNRLEDAAAVAFARSARAIHVGDVAHIRRGLVAVGYLPDIARRMAVRMGHLMVQRLSPAAIAHVLVPKGHPLASTIWASLRGIASRAYANVATTEPRGREVAPVDGSKVPARKFTEMPEVRNWTHTQLDADATHFRLTFAYHKEAVRLAAQAGFTFDTASKTWLRPIDAPPLADPPGSRLTIEALLARRTARLSAMAVAAEPIRVALKNIGVSWTEDRIVLQFPSGNEYLAHKIVALGARPVPGGHGTRLELAPPHRSAENGLIEALRDIDATATAPEGRFARRTIEAQHPGIAMTTDGATLELRAADMPLRNLILRDLQPVYRSDGTIAVRLDMQQPGAVTGALGRLAAYYDGLIVPPSSPTNGIAVTEAQLDGWERAPAASLGTAWSEATNVMRMIERHFGRAERISETPASRGVNADVIDRLQRFADRVTSARKELALEQAVRSLKR